MREALRQRAPRLRWSYYTLHYSLDTAGRQRASRVEYNKRAAPHLIPNVARRPQLRRATRLPRFLHQCLDQNASEYSPTPPHRRATAIHRILSTYVVRRCRPAEHAMHLRWRPAAALSSVVELAPRRAAPWSARCADAQLTGCAAHGAGCAGAQRSRLRAHMRTATLTQQQQHRRAQLSPPGSARAPALHPGLRARTRTSAETAVRAEMLASACTSSSACCVGELGASADMRFCCPRPE